LKDLEKLYNMLEKEQKELQKFYDVLKPVSLFDTKTQELEALLEDFLEFVSLAKNSETLLAAINRIVNLREDTLLNLIRNYSEEKQIEIKERAYVWVSRFYTARFERMLGKIEKEGMLTPFYQELLWGAHRVGEVFSSWQSSWMAQIVYGVNRELFRLFNGDEEKIFEMLQRKGLLDKGHAGEPGDRSYSVLRLKENGEFERLSYAQAFEEETKEAAARIEELVGRLALLEDEYKNEWIEYLIRIKEALLERDPDRLIGMWARVDESWMRIKSPIQIGHPLEYYEDHYRKAVALEWDVRVANPNYRANKRAKYVKSAFKSIYQDLDVEDESVYRATLSNIDRTQIYVGRPFSFYGSEFNGLFSAQVVPNDEVVSRRMGKKIFAYADMVYQTQKAKPFMKIHSIVYGKELVKKFKEVFKRPDIWHEVYDITTIGHEFGHILWMDEESETLMNKRGQFKNLEEFKATVGGLVSYFMFEDERLWEYVLEDIVTRAVSLIGWMEVEEVQPYYVEGLLHLVGLFDSGVLEFKDNLKVNINKQNYDKLKNWYLDIYRDIAAHYLKKEDSRLFLDRYLTKEKNILPKDIQTRSFVDYYYELYKKIGTQMEREME